MPMSAEQVTDLPAAGSLRANAIGLPDVIFTSVTTMAPAAAAAFSISVGAIYAGGSLVAGVVIALVGCLFTALSIGQMARHLPSAGGMYTYIAHGLGSRRGFLARRGRGPGTCPAPAACTPPSRRGWAAGSASWPAG